MQMRLSWSALLFTRRHLRTGGNAAIKVRYGEEYKLFCEAAKFLFRRSVEVKPPASRPDSAEAYIVGMNAVRYDAGAGPAGDPLAGWCDDRVRAILMAHGLVK